MKNPRSHKYLEKWKGIGISNGRESKEVRGSYTKDRKSNGRLIFTDDVESIV